MDGMQACADSSGKVRRVAGQSIAGEANEMGKRGREAGTGLRGRKVAVGW